MTKHFYILLLIVFCGCGNKSENSTSIKKSKENKKEIIIAPEVLTSFVIVYEFEFGKEIKLNEKEEYIFEIPENGILLLKNKRQRGFINHSIFWKTISDSLILLHSVEPYKEEVINIPVGSYFLGIGWSEEGSICNSSNKDYIDHKCVVYDVNNDHPEVNIEDSLKKYLTIKND